MCGGCVFQKDMALDVMKNLAFHSLSRKTSYDISAAISIPRGMTRYVSYRSYQMILSNLHSRLIFSKNKFTNSSQYRGNLTNVSGKNDGTCILAAIWIDDNDICLCQYQYMFITCMYMPGFHCVKLRNALVIHQGIIHGLGSLATSKSAEQSSEPGCGLKQWLCIYFTTI